jgi:hypothetical protein
MGGVPSKKLTEIKAEAKRFSEIQTQVLDGLTKYIENEDFKAKNEPVIVFNFASDATAMPVLISATLQIINTETKKADNAGVVFTPICSFKYGKHMVDG